MTTDEHLDALMPPGMREMGKLFGDSSHPKFPIAHPRPTAQEILMMGGYLWAGGNK